MHCLRLSSPFLQAQGCGKWSRGEERLSTFLFPPTMLLSLCQALAGLLLHLEPGAGCCVSLVDSLVPMRLQAAGQKCRQGSRVQSGML